MGFNSLCPPSIHPSFGRSIPSIPREPLLPHSVVQVEMALFPSTGRGRVTKVQPISFFHPSGNRDGVQDRHVALSEPETQF